MFVVMQAACSGLSVVLHVLSSVRWSVLSQTSTSAQHDLFNVVAVALPVLINSVEENDDSRRIIENECGQYTMVLACFGCAFMLALMTVVVCFACFVQSVPCCPKIAPWLPLRMPLCLRLHLPLLHCRSLPATSLR
jgi:hypothetical protein